MTTTDRDRLAGIIAPALVSTNPNRVQEFDDLLKHAQRRWIARASEVADALLAAGVTLPRRLETAEELDALPKHTTIVTFYECVIQLGEATGRGWRVGFVPGVGPMRTVSVSDLPAIVLWTPGGAQ